MVFSDSMRASGITDSAQQLIQAVVGHEATVRPGARPEWTPAGAPTALAATSRQQPKQALTHVAIHFVELIRRMARPEVAAPAAQDRIQHPDHFPDVLHPGPTPPFGEVVDLGAECLHRSWRRPAEQVTPPLEVGAYDPQVTSQEREALLAQAQLHQSCLGRMQLQTQPI